MNAAAETVVPAETLSVSQPSAPEDVVSATVASTKASSKILRRVLFAVAFALIAAAATFGAYHFGGNDGLTASLTGVAFGGLIGLLAWIHTVIQMRTDKRVVFHVLLGTFMSMILFAVGVLAVAVFWRAALVPASLSALPIYLLCKFTIVFTASSRASSSSKTSAETQTPGNE